MTNQSDQSHGFEPPPYQRVSVLGAGAWGTALALVAVQAGRDVTLWGRSTERLEAMRVSRKTPFLHDVELPTALNLTSDLDRAIEGAEAVLVVTPSQTIRTIAAALAPVLAPKVPLVLCAKGVETETGLLLNEVVAEELPDNPVGALSGPTFAIETALGHPTAATIAFPFSYKDRLAPADSPAARMAVTLGTGTFRPYISDDLVGVEVAGAVKNVIAIACGIVTGAGYAENTRAALITRGMDEMKALAIALGGRGETLSGLSGAGDLMLTCSSTTSRNMSLGVQLGQGVLRDACFDGRAVVVEGEVNALAVVRLARRLGVELPICTAVHDVLHKGTDIEAAFTGLWSRPLRAEAPALDLTMDHKSAFRPIGDSKSS